MSNNITEDQAYALGKEAYIYGYPFIYYGRHRHNLVNVRDMVQDVRQRPNAWMHYNRVVTPEVIGAPQTDTLYSQMWGDLTQEPLIVRIPKMDGRYWSIQTVDMFASTLPLPNRRTFSEAVDIAYVAPGWSGTLPEGIAQVYRSTTPWIFSVLRMHFSSEADRAVAHAFQCQFEAMPLSVYVAGMKWEAPLVNVYAAPAFASDPLSDFKLLQHMWQECPPPAADSAVVEKFAAIGLRQACEYGFDSLSEDARRGLARAQTDSWALLCESAKKIPGGVSVNGWTLPKASLGLYHDGDYFYRALTTLVGTVCIPNVENVYMVLQADGQGQLLQADSCYELYYSKEDLPQSHAFWSLHAYRYQGYTVIPNPIQRYSISNRTKGLRYAADGSLTIYLQAQDPGGEKSANWLPTCNAGQPYMLITRAYEPYGAMLELKWPGPKLIQVLG